jgi:protein-S-isoprenylcysteine O-methyltransferase Ste14
MASERGASVRFPPPLVFVSALALGTALDRFVRSGGLPLERPLRVGIAAAVIALGIALIVSARVLFVRTGQSPVPWKPTPSLIGSGPYRFTRNPMYLGATTILLGLGLMMDNGWVGALALPALAVVHYIAVLPEERYLQERFGGDYVAYMDRVRRYL